jgi:hypothetical protein
MPESGNCVGRPGYKTRWWSGREVLFLARLTFRSEPLD